MEDDISVKALKNRIYDDIEVWNIIYFSIFTFACLEENHLPIGQISWQNFLILSRKLKYFYGPLYDTEKIVLEQDSHLFEKHWIEYVLFILSILNIMHDFDADKFSESSSTEKLLKKAINWVSSKLWRFVKNILYEN